MLARARDYLALTRPRILALVALTAPCASALDRGRWPEPALLAALVGGTAAVGAGGSALNAWWERERDARMTRTRARPLPAGRLPARAALAFGAAVSALGIGVLWAGAGAASAALGAATLAHYLVVYTVWLKPRSPWSTVVGSAAGAAAPLIADAALDGRVGTWGLVLFAIVFLWQPPHVWAIGLYRRDEYAAAGFPLLPVVRPAAVVRRRMLGWALALAPVALLPWAAGPLGSAYALTAALACGAFLASIALAQRVDAPAADRRVFRVSLAALTAIFGAMTLELALR